MKSNVKENVATNDRNVSNVMTTVTNVLPPMRPSFIVAMMYGLARTMLAISTAAIEGQIEMEWM
jgi:hypothetical protein